MDAREGHEAVKGFPHHRNSYRQGTGSCDMFGKVKKHLSLLGEGKDCILNLYF